MELPLLETTKEGFPVPISTDSVPQGEVVPIPALPPVTVKFPELIVEEAEEIKPPVKAERPLTNKVEEAFKTPVT